MLALLDFPALLPDDLHENGPFFSYTLLEEEAFCMENNPEIRLVTPR